MIPSELFLIAGALGVGIGILIVKWIEQRDRKKRRAAIASIRRARRLSSHPSRVCSFEQIGVPALRVLERPTVADYARILRENTAPEPQQTAAE